MTPLESLKIGDTLTVFPTQVVGTRFLGVDSVGRCYPLDSDTPLVVGEQLTVERVFTDLPTPMEAVAETDNHPDLQIKVMPVVAYKYGWDGVGAERNLFSLSGEVCRLSSEMEVEGIEYFTADLAPGVYVRLACSADQSQAFPVVIQMTHDGPHEHVGAAIELA